MTETGASARTQLIVPLLVGIGILLRVWQFSGGASLFTDEIALATNIAERNYLSLFTPLNYSQVAPPGFLVIERFFWTQFHSDWSLRLMPFVASVGSLLLMSLLARRTIRAEAVPIAVGAFAVGIPFVMYAGQVKQYSSDIAIAIGIWLAAIKVLDDTSGRRQLLLLLGLGGTLSVWFSNTAVLVIASVSAALLILALTNRLPNRRQVLLCMVGPWLVAAILAAFETRYTVSATTMSLQKEAWPSGFPPLQPWTMTALLWPWQRALGIFDAEYGGLGYHLAPLFVLAACAGCAAMWHKRPAVAQVLFAPVALAFLAAVLRLYPFHGRVILFLYPVILLAVAHAVAAGAVMLSRRTKVATTALLIVVGALIAQPMAFRHPVYRIQEMGTLLKRLAAQRQPGDVVFVWYWAVPNVAWDGPAHGFRAGTYIAGGCWLGSPRRFIQESDQLRGQPRVWIVEAGGGSALAAFNRYIDMIGRKGEELRVIPTERFFPVWATLYDFSDATRLRNTTAESFSFDIRPASSLALKSCIEGPATARFVF